jgi:Flp pilus assembly pilin Flp
MAEYAVLLTMITLAVVAAFILIGNTFASTVIRAASAL